ncbi:MAG: UvrD-helicase domain-containing protein [Bacteroidales bacterium]|nr:UvrD-helicase domain-containing protein [Bacteroidales bacterium]
MQAPTEIDLFKDLNENQVAAVKATEGMVRVVAGAGSGKTRVLAHRYAYLVNNMGIDPANILCATFTNKAAQEMRNRIAKLVSAGNVNDFVCTIHSLCVRILRQEIHRIGYPKNFTIIDEEDQKSLAKEVFKEFSLDNTEITTKQFLEGIFCLKNDGTKEKTGYENYIESIILPNANVPTESVTPEIAYIKKQRKSFLLDFEDLIMFALYILNHFEEAKEYWQKQMNYIMLDEAQDCSGYDWSIVRLLGEKHKNIFIVGDPDQCIYEWRGVKIDNFLHFPAETDIILNENYRSIPNILDVANSIISHNKRRIKKDLLTRKEGTTQAIHFHGKTEVEEYDWIAEQISKLKEHGCKGNDIAILYRASHISRGVEQALMRKNIKYEVWGGIRFFERREVKDALCYLRLIANQDDLSFKRVVNTPGRSFGPASIEKLEQLAAEENTTLFAALKNHQDASFIIKRDEMSEFIRLIEECKSFIGQKPVLDILDYVLKQSGYIDLLRKDEDQDRIDNLNELLLSVKYYQETHEENTKDVEAYLQDIALYTNMDFKKEESSVKLMTIHQAKGLEFPYVFVCGLSEGLFPSARTIRESKEAGLEEERRLMYVAVTRAEKGLFLSDSEGFNHSVGGDKYPSRFLREIKKSLFVIEGEFDESLFNGTDNIIHSIDRSHIGFINHRDDPMKFKVGDQVKHHALGIGTIVEVGKNNDYYVVDFNGNVRNIRAGYRFGRYFTPGAKVLFRKNEAEVMKRVDDDSLVISVNGRELCVKDSELVAKEKEEILVPKRTKSQIKDKQKPTTDKPAAAQIPAPSAVDTENTKLQEENRKLKKEIEELRKTIESQDAKIKSLSQNKDEKDVMVEAYEREIDLLRSLKSEHEKRQEEDKRTIHDLTIKQGELTHGIGEKDVQIKHLQDEIGQLKAELERVNNKSVMQRLFGKK